MDIEQVALAVEDAVRDPAIADRDHVSLMILFHRAASEPTHSVPSAMRLVEVLRAQPELRLFDGRYQTIPGGCSRIDFSFLGRWLVLRGFDVGAMNAVEDLQRYTVSRNVRFRTTIALSRVSVPSRLPLAEGMEIWPWKELPRSYYVNSTEERAIHASPFAMPSAALIRWSEFEVLHDDLPPSKLPPPIAKSDLFDSILCLTLVGPSVPIALADWVEPDGWAPVASAGMGVGEAPFGGRNYEFSTDAVAEASAICQRFLSLSDSRKQRLRIPMRRLNTAMHRRTKEDSIIDIGIALESLFLTDLEPDRGELTFRLRLRGARYLSDAEERRRDLFALLGRLYGVRSEAVHVGTVSDQTGLEGLLEDGFSIVAEAIRRFIAEGEPNWSAVLLR